MCDGLAKVDGTAVQVTKVGLLVVRTYHIEFVEFRRDLVCRLLPWLGPSYLLSHVAVNVPVVVC